MVGGSAGLVYTPESVNAAVGDMINFTFMSKNHTVTQSAFDKPCVRMPKGKVASTGAHRNLSVLTLVS